MLHAEDFGAQIPGNGRQLSQRGQRGAGDLKGNLSGGGNGAANRDQHTAGRYVQGSGKLQEFLFGVGMTSDKDGDG
jgi:hypothetical protein